MDSTEAEDQARGRRAGSPWQIPKAGWRDILLRTKDEMSHDHVSLIAAGVAFYGLLALFPAIAVLISLWALMFDPQIIGQQIEMVSQALPEQAAAIIKEQAQAVARGAGTGVSIAAIIGLMFSLYTAATGVKSLIEGLNIIYGEQESRSFIMYNVVAFLLTIALVVIMLVTLGLIVVLPAVLSIFGQSDTMAMLINWLRWPLLAVVAILGLGIVYRFAPNRTNPRWQWVSVGAVIATVLWIIGSAGFSIYVSNFASYNEVYGSLGAVIVLLVWFWLSAFIVLMGAELNAEIEHQTARDSTVNGCQPMGERGAYVADTLGKTRS